jgi:glycosyltransferase involved in cell wall biosynthesis
VTRADRAPSVCVAIPVKNGSAYLAEAIESVLAQTGVDLSVRVLDNGSDDDSLEIALGYTSDPRLTADRNPADIHYYGSLNRVLAESGADYFVPFAADDVMCPDNLRRKVQALEETGAAFANSSATQIDDAGTATGVGPDHVATPSLLAAPEFFRLLVPRNCVSCQSVVARSSTLREIGGFDGRSIYAADWLTWLRLSLRGPVVTFAEPLIANRIHAQAATTTYGATGLDARDVPSTLDHVFLDEALPAEWREWRDPMVAVAHVDAAVALSRVGLTRVAHGWAGYLAMGRALARQPRDPRMLANYDALLNAAGLVPPAAPYDAVAPAPADAGEAAAMAATADELAPLLGRLIIGVEPDELDAVMALLEPCFATTELDVVVVPTVDALELIVPGRLVIARWGSELVGQAEDAGVPVYPYDIPGPFEGPPDASRWQTVDVARCLP